MEPEERLIDFRESAEELTCVFLNRMDTIATAKVDTAFREKLASSAGRSIVFDLGKVDYVASSFLRFCVIASKEGKGKLSIINIMPTVRKVLKIAGFERIAELK